jgi:hypothetical protein
MDSGQLSIEKLTQLLNQQTFPASIEATLIAIRECSMFTRKDLFMLANRFIFCHTQSSTQSPWKKTLNNIQELHTLDILRQFLDNQTDLTISTRVFDIIFFDILSDQDHPLFTLYYNLILKFLSLVISFESKITLTIIARWFLTQSKNIDSLITKIIEYIIHEHIALAITKSINNLCMISPLFTLCFINQTCLLLDQENFIIDIKTFQTLIELITYGLTNSTSLLLLTLQQEFLAENNSSLFNFVPSMIRLNILLPIRSDEYSSLSLHFDHFHTSILSFLFSIVINNQNQILQKHLISSNYFEQLSMIIQDSISREQSDEKRIHECIQRYLQIFSICKISSLPLTQLSINDLGKTFPLLTHHKLFDILKDKEGIRIT